MEGAVIPLPASVQPLERPSSAAKCSHGMSSHREPSSGVAAAPASRYYFERRAGNCGYLPGFTGGLAQLGERLNGIQEVEGSTPLSSTRSYSKSQPVVAGGRKPRERGAFRVSWRGGSW